MPDHKNGTCLEGQFRFRGFGFLTTEQMFRRTDLTFKGRTVFWLLSATKRCVRPEKRNLFFIASNPPLRG